MAEDARMFSRFFSHFKFEDSERHCGRAVAWHICFDAQDRRQRGNVPPAAMVQRHFLC